MEKRLVAILHADVVGYTRHTARDERRTHQNLDVGLNLLTDVVAAHNGLKVHEAGDAILAEFQSVTEAVVAAVEFQRQMFIHNAELSEDEWLEFRVGINLGEVIHDRDDIYGDGVNLAARIQELSEPGGLCISSSVYEQVSGKIPEECNDMGYRKLKNIDQPVHVYQVRIIELTDSSVDQPGWPYLTGGKKNPLATGGCLCRSVKFETWGEPIMVAYCHCRFCQLATGAPLNAAAVYEKVDVRFHGEHKIYKSSLIAERAFCGNCGTSLYTTHYAPDEGDYVVIRLATMDKPADFPPTIHYGVESQVPWLDIHDDLPRMRASDDPEMQRRWSAVGRPDPADQIPNLRGSVRTSSDKKKELA